MFTILIRRDFTQFIFSGKNYFVATRCIIGTSKYLVKKKNYYCKEHKFSLMFTGLFIVFNEATNTTSPLVTLLPSPPHPSVDHGQHTGHRPELCASLGTLRIARNFTHRFTHRYSIISPPVTLRTTNAESENIATLELKYRTSRTNFTHRIA